jgi:O-antigen ligase
MSKAFAIASFVIILPVAFALTQLSTISSDDASSAGRIDAWGEGIQMLKSNPVFGVGHGLFKDHHHIAAHSSYVEVFSETGLVGYFFWLGFVSMSLYGLYRFSFKFSLPDQDTVSAVDAKKLADYKSLSTALVFSLVAFMVTAFFISRSMQPLLFILCAMSAGLFFQIRQHYPDFMQLTFSSTFRICMFSTLLSVLFVYITIRLFW